MVNDSIPGLIQSLVDVINSYGINYICPYVMSNVIGKECCSDCKWSRVLLKAAEIFQREEDEGRNRALISVIFREGVHRFDRLLNDGMLMPSYSWLAIAALLVSKFYVLYEKY